MTLHEPRSQLLRRIGVRNSIMGLVTLCRDQILRSAYKFDAWHATSNFYLKPYKKQVIGLILDSDPSQVIEVGCGLGDILSRTNARTRIGIDADWRVIKAAKLLHPRINFQVGEFSNIHWQDLELTNENKILVTAVNWPHMLPPEELLAGLSAIPTSGREVHLLIDIILEGVSGYPHHHSRTDLERVGKIISITPSLDQVREFILVDLSS